LLTFFCQASSGAPIDPQVAGKLLQHIAQGQSGLPVKSNLTLDLSEREREILKLLADGLANGDIAKRLHLSKGRAQNYASTILLKLDVTDRTQATLLALRHGLVA
jgi:DNA-binding NarL/FixJ family response regulator